MKIDLGGFDPDRRIEIYEPLKRAPMAFQLSWLTEVEHWYRHPRDGRWWALAVDVKDADGLSLLMGGGSSWVNVAPGMDGPERSSLVLEGTKAWWKSGVDPMTVAEYRANWESQGFGRIWGRMRLVDVDPVRDVLPTTLLRLKPDQDTPEQVAPAMIPRVMPSPTFVPIGF